ncbi:MAG: hypothetical protein ACJAVC_000516 [Brevundimonas sp.]|jgi:hypothetical protein
MRLMSPKARPKSIHAYVPLRLPKGNSSAATAMANKDRRQYGPSPSG